MLTFTCYGSVVKELLSFELWLYFFNDDINIAKSNMRIITWPKNTIKTWKQHAKHILITAAMLVKDSSMVLAKSRIICLFVCFLCHQTALTSLMICFSAAQVYTRYGKCYTFNGNKTTSRKTKQGGMGNGLEIMLDIQQDEYLPIWRETSKLAFSSHCSNGHCSACPFPQMNLYLTPEKPT